MSVNYCKKCKTEVPMGETCPHCGGKLTKTGEQISFGIVRIPCRDWFAWNDILRIIIPLLLVCLVASVWSEISWTGSDAIVHLAADGTVMTFLVLLAAILLIVFLILLLQGPERIHCVLDKDGVHLRTYLANPTAIRFFARFTSDAAVQKLAAKDDRPQISGLILVRYVFVPWNGMRKVHCWRKGGMLLFYKLPFWQAAAVCCPYDTYPEAEEFIRRKMKRNKKARVLPKLQA